MESSQIPPLTLPSGGTVEFVDLDDLTGEHLADMRRPLRSQDATGEQVNLLHQQMMRVAIKTWDIPYLADPRTPEANPAAWKKLRLRDSLAIHKALRPLYEMVNGTDTTEDDGTPGSPPQPDSE